MIPGGESYGGEAIRRMKDRRKTKKEGKRPSCLLITARKMQSKERKGEEGGNYEEERMSTIGGSCC